jgi:hypothetical protein
MKSSAATEAIATSKFQSELAREMANEMATNKLHHFQQQKSAENTDKDDLHHLELYSANPTTIADPLLSHSHKAHGRHGSDGSGRIAPALHSENNNGHTQVRDQEEKGIMAVLHDLTHGAIDEFKNHPERWLASAAIGAGAAVVATVLAPEILAAAGLIGACQALGAISSNLNGWIEDIKVVANPQGHSTDELARAHAGLRQIGAGALDLAAGAVGGGLAVGLRGGLRVKGELNAPTSHAQTDANTKGWSALRAPESTSEKPIHLFKPLEIFPGQKHYRIVNGTTNDFQPALASREGHGVKLLVQEVNNGKLGPIEKLWLQHHGGRLKLNRDIAGKADKILCCHPHQIPESALRAKHIYPNHNDVVWTQPIVPGRSQFIVWPQPPRKAPVDIEW